MMADEDISLNEDQILDNLDDNGEMLNEVSENIFFLILAFYSMVLVDLLIS